MAGEGPYLEDYLEADRDDPARATERFNRDKEAYDAAWQLPQELDECLARFIRALQDDTGVFSRLGIDEGYFVNGVFKHDLNHLWTMVQWYAENGEDKERLLCLM